MKVSEHINMKVTKSILNKIDEALSRATFSAFLTPDGHLLMGTAESEFKDLIHGLSGRNRGELFKHALQSGYIPLSLIPDDSKKPENGGVILEVHGELKEKEIVSKWAKMYPTWTLYKQ